MRVLHSQNCQFGAHVDSSAELTMLHYALQALFTFPNEYKMMLKVR